MDSPRKTIRVLHCDDDESVRGLVQAWLRPHAAIRVVEGAVDHADVVVKAARSQPDVVLLDLDACRDEGVVRRLRRTCSARILIFSGNADIADDPLVAQADGFLPKDAGAGAITAAVLAGEEGGRP